MDGLFVSISSVLGAPADQIKLIFCLLVAYPLSTIYVRLPKDKPHIKYVYNIAVSMFFLVPILRLYWGTAHLLLSSTFTYFAAKRIKSQNMPWVVFAFVMAHLLVNHAYRTAYLTLDDLEITGTQMVLVIKLSTFAWNIYDGRQPTESLDHSQLATRVQEYPSLLEFLGYVFYFPGLLVGPAFEFVSYRSLIDETIFVPPESSSNGGSQVSEKNDSVPKIKRRVPAGRKRVAYLKFAQGLVFLLLFTLFNPQFNYGMSVDPKWSARPFWYKLGTTQLFGFVARTKYYGAWSLTEGAAILSGLGFNGFDATGQPRWDKTANIDIKNIEFAPNFKVLLDSWNINTNVWLRNCIYKRVTPQGKRPGFKSSMLTFLTSALWHGFCGGYYLTFILGGFIQTVARQCRTFLRPLFAPPLLSPPPKGQKKQATKVLSSSPPPTLSKRVYDFLGIVCTQLILNYVAGPFCLLTISASIKSWSNMAWYGHIMVFVPLLFFKSPATGLLKNMATQREERARFLARGTPELVVLPPTPATDKFSDSPDVVGPIHKTIDESRKDI
ncbi:membrane-bound acyltransferase family [Rhizoctonia solani]|uniref:Membrane-bound acyltransferase family n=1 Tax=Rhizoctonia solani TaxID=456999 RepID=A0A8H7HC71_9AGAM|nr:membrane-bound acyltransferase family [Rhizoctonia solani]